jgi:hypothetical protein
VHRTPDLYLSSSKLCSAGKQFLPSVSSTSSQGRNCRIGDRFERPGKRYPTPRSSIGLHLRSFGALGSWVSSPRGPWVNPKARRQWYRTTSTRMNWWSRAGDTCRLVSGRTEPSAWVFHREAGTPHFAWDDPALLDMGGCFCKSHLVEARSGVLIAREFTSEGHSVLQLQTIG